MNSLLTKVLQASSTIRGVGLSVVPCRSKHAVFSGGRRGIPPPPPKQPPKDGNYNINYNPQPEGLLGWADWAMKKDVRKRKGVRNWGATHNNLRAMKFTTILPREITEMATKERASMPKDAKTRWLMYRCAVSSRALNNVKDWRLSRFMFRHLADYNKLSGVRRALW